MHCACVAAAKRAQLTHNVVGLWHHQLVCLKGVTATGAATACWCREVRAHVRWYCI
jgi:hypothetical protein